MASLKLNVLLKPIVQLSEGVRQRLSAVVFGLALGASAVLFGLLTSIGGPLVGFGVLIGLGAGLYVLTDLMAGLYLTVIVVALLPFATLPVKIAVTPTLIDCAMGAFILVYLFQWMTGRRSRPRFVPAHLLIVAFILFSLFSFVAGLGHAALTTKVLREFVELMVIMTFAIILVDVIRDAGTLRRIALAILVMGAAQAVIGIGLVIINAQTAERLLNALSRFGYPAGGVIRYVEENPALAERAIGTWIDPNAYGGFLLLVAVLGGSQILAEKPVTGSRWLAAILFAPVAVALLLTQSRGALVALAAAVVFFALMRYRWLLLIMIATGIAFYALPFTQGYVNRFLQGVNNEDLATQMRFGEYKDALILIGRYPLIGVGFAGTPDRDIYLGVSSMYLTIAGNTGLVGLCLYLLIIAEIFRYGLWRWRKLRRDPMLANVWLGFAGALLGAMVGGIFDHFYFNIEFNGAALMFWIVAGLALTSARLADDVSPKMIEPETRRSGSGGAGDGTRTRDVLLGKQAFYR